MSSPSPFRLDLAARSSIGFGLAARLENQDNYLTIDTEGRACYLVGQVECRRQVADWPKGHARVAVLDGMGGHGHGREAAEAVVAGLLYLPPMTELAPLEAALDTLHTQLQQAFAADAGRRPGTTLTLLEIPPGAEALLYHVGDSRLYEISDTKITPLSVDHVPATSYAMSGTLGEQDWWQQVHGEHRPQISQAFMLGNAFANPAQLSDPLFPLTPANLPPWLARLADRRVLRLRPNVTYVLATDGFWSCDYAMAWMARWPALVNGGVDSHGALYALFAEMSAHPPAGLQPDNVTAVALRLIPVGLTLADETALPEPLFSQDHA